jgi:tetratricopeptide (TPR) repeat protein
LLLVQGRDGGIRIGSARDVSVFLGVPQAVARSAYLEQVRRIAPPVLKDREGELAEVARFCLDPGGAPYTWWRAGPWAGKSALLSTFVLHPPPDVAGQVRIVSFFITGRLAAQDTRETFIEVMLEQLAALLGQSLPTVLSEATREAYLLALLSEAARACKDAGGRLVLVVDGLNEERRVATGPGAHSIAGLLPADPPAGMRVIVAGRPSPPVPDDVPDWHPLRDPAIIRPLSASAHARGVQQLGWRELQRLLRGSPAEQDVLGLLAAARGGLSAWDLADLAGAQRREVVEILRTVAGRTLLGRPSLLDPTTHQEVYLLGHEELQAAAIDYLGDRLAGYRERLHAWADGWRASNWPAETPEYMLAGYFRLLDDTGDLPRMTECALDMARHDRMLDLTGGDAAALAEARTTLDRIAAQDAPDLASALALACHRDQLADRNAHIPLGLPAAWAALGQLPRAQALAASITSPRSQENALAEVAGALARAGQFQQAEAVTWSITSPDSQADALAEVAGALARAGQRQQAAAAAARAQAIAGSITTPESQTRALAKVAGALAQAGQFQQAAAAAARAEGIARSITRLLSQEDALAEVAGALAQAGQLAQAEAIARSITYPNPQGHALAEVAGALAWAGQLAQAEAIARSITNPDWEARALAKIAVALAQAGQHGAAADAAVSAERAVTCAGMNAHAQASILVWVAKTLAQGKLSQQAAAAAAHAETAARSITNPRSQAYILAEVAGALAEAGQRHQAAAAATRAETAARSTTEPVSKAHAMAQVAEALAQAGQRQQAAAAAARAEAIAQSITNPYEQARALARIAGAFARAGRRTPAVAAAVAAMRAIAGSSYGANILAEVAGALAQAGQRRQAAAVAADAEAVARWTITPGSEPDGLAGVAEALAKAGQLQQAEAIAQSITKPESQADALAKVAGVLARAGQHEQAAAAATRAETVARSITDLRSQAGALAGAAGALAQTGQRQRAAAARAEAIAGSITDPKSRAPVLAKVTGALAQAGQHDQAEATARSITHPYHQADALAKVAGALAQAGQHDQAEAIARSITDPDVQAHILAEVAEVMAQAGDTHRASRVAAATCATGRWTTAAKPVLLLMPSAFAALASTLKEQ